ncbi:MAG: MBOAT family protein, partial [Pseudobdellovibrionaceae bacterium]
MGARRRSGCRRRALHVHQRFYAGDMSFDSPLFIFFFATVLLVYSVLLSVEKARLLLLLGAGIFFISQGNLFSLVVLSIYTIVTICLAHAISCADKQRRRIFALSLVLNFSSLLVFRIYQGQWNIFPLGFSFYSFASVTYLVDIYFRRCGADAFQYAVAVSFFPTLISGPIFRLRNLIAQLKSPEVLDWVRARESSVLIANGFFKKAVSELISTSVIEGLTHTQPALSRFAWLQVIVFVAKYYADFSGYSDIAIGTAGLLGIKVPANFNLPFLATSIGDFWRRWHMTLNHWMNEYVFKPLIYTDALAFLRRIPQIGPTLFERRQYTAILAAMLAIGLWHGLTLTFALWGVYMGVLLGFEMAFASRWKPRLPRPIKIFATFFLVLNGYVIFMQPSLQSALEMFSRMYDPTVAYTSLGMSYVIVVSLVLLVPHIFDFILIKNEYFKNHT